MCVCEDIEIESLLGQFISNTVQSSNLQSQSYIAKRVPAIPDDYENTSTNTKKHLVKVNVVIMHHNSRRLSLEITNVFVKEHKASGRVWQQAILYLSDYSSTQSENMLRCDRCGWYRQVVSRHHSNTLYFAVFAAHHCSASPWLADLSDK